ncbi:MAG TPA: hypothetical protein VGC79_08290 [Polyangiaceae bacterium]
MKAKKAKRGRGRPATAVHARQGDGSAQDAGSMTPKKRKVQAPAHEPDQVDLVGWINERIALIRRDMSLALPKLEDAKRRDRYTEAIEACISKLETARQNKEIDGAVLWGMMLEWHSHLLSRAAHDEPEMKATKNIGASNARRAGVQYEQIIKAIADTGKMVEAAATLGITTSAIRKRVPKDVRKELLAEGREKRNSTGVAPRGRK